MNEIKIKTEYIKLQQLLKLAGIISQGSDARLLISNGDVTLNGEPVSERGKKIRAGDIVSVRDFGEIKVCI